MTLWSVVDSQEAITVPVRRRLTCSIEVSRTVVTACSLRLEWWPAPIPIHFTPTIAAREAVRRHCPCRDAPDAPIWAIHIAKPVPGPVSASSILRIRTDRRRKIS
ncbi:hypothetical protein GCM10012289_54260 [Nonomuraea cavernae]|uniref:Uncharacterized protein n=1 Tax=Nonomuraea cavernae TaxID=2045107 RepID=A0A918DQ29_9ACTN|nr:hypothetical protein GCM10012289_54260 [Nonomuraea cavernae]